MPYRRTASHEFLSRVRTRLLLSRHTILYLSGSFTKVVRARGTFIFYFTNQKRRNYRYIQMWNRQGMLGKIDLRRSKTSLRCWAASFWWRGWSRRKQTLGWFSNRTGTSVDDGARKSTTGLTNGTAANGAPEVEFSPYRALSRRQMTFPFCCQISLLPIPYSKQDYSITSSKVDPSLCVWKRFESRSFTRILPPPHPA